MLVRNFLPTVALYSYGNRRKQKVATNRNEFGKKMEKKTLKKIVIISSHYL